MATATASRNLWNEPFKREELFQQFSSNVKPARTIRPNSSFPRITRSLSFGSPTFPRRKPSPIRRKTKSVHFADSKGLALVSVVTFNEENELREQFSKLTQTTAGKRRFKLEGYLSTNKKSNKIVSEKLPEKVVAQLAWQKVCVHSTECLKSGKIRGKVYVANLAYEKRVKARYSLDSWQTHNEVDGNFHSNCTNDIDRFVFEIPIPKKSAVKNFKVEFAVSYTVLGDTYWDNNNGFNYHVLCVSHN